MEVRYAPGGGVLLARSGRWLLLGTSQATGMASVLDRLWDDLGQPGAQALALATVRRHLPGTPLVWLDSATGEHLAHDGGDATRHGDRWELRVADSATPAVFRLVDGVVAAASVQVTGAVPLGGDPPTPAGPVIDGVPPEILAATGPQRPLPARMPEATGTARRERLDADPDHDHLTVMRRGFAAPPAPAPDGALLEPTTSDTVLAVRCERGHLTDPLADGCRSCGGSVPPQEPQRVVRPPLGALRLPGEQLVVLDRPVVLGRRPAASGPGDWPHLVELPQDSTYLSRNHLRIDLDGWHVLAEDLGSRGGTTVLAPGRDPERIRAHEPYVLEHGTVLDLAGAYRVTYLAAPPGSGLSEGGS